VVDQLRKDVALRDDLDGVKGIRPQLGLVGRQQHPQLFPELVGLPCPLAYLDLDWQRELGHGKLR
jgi:hypothetical protein